MNRSKYEIIDLCAELQDDVLDLQHDWLRNLPVTDQVRTEVFEHMCTVTGTLLNKLLELGDLKT